MSTLILTAHGSRDPRSAANTRAIAGHLRRVAPEFAVRVAFCEHSTPHLSDVLGGVSGDVTVVPFLLASAYHARVDIPSLIAQSGGSASLDGGEAKLGPPHWHGGSASLDGGEAKLGPPHWHGVRVRVRQAAALGEDPRLVQVLGERLTQAGVSRFDPDLGVLVVAVGSSHTEANARTALVAERLSDGTRWAGAEMAFATGPAPSVPDAVARLRERGASRLVIAPWFLAHGRITDGIADYAHRSGIPMAEPLGAHRLVAATVLDRVEAALGQVAA